MKTVYICEDTIIGIFSGIYEAWKTKLDEQRLGIALRGNLEQELFCEYKEVKSDEKKAVAVGNLIRKHLSHDAYYHFYHALLSSDKDKADVVLGAMLEARNIKDSKRIMQHLTHPKVRRVFELSRKVANEAHFFVELIRFRELNSGIMFAQIEPKSQILTCIGDHFENRFPLENFMIYDKTHNQFLIHEAQKAWVLVINEELDVEQLTKLSYGETMFSELWKSFFEHISIKERENYRLQRQNLPIRFRKNMTEF